VSEEPKPAAAAALTALGSAIASAVESLAVGVGQDRLAAFQCVDAIKKALPLLGDLLDLVPGLVQLASPGRTVSERLADGNARLASQHAELETAWAQLQALTAVEDQVQEAAAETSRLQARIDEIERTQRLAQDLPVLRAQLEALEEASADATDGDEAQVAERLTAGARRLLTLTERQRALLGTETDKMIGDLGAAQEALAAERSRAGELRTELATRIAEAEQLRNEHERNLPALVAYRQADQDLADGLGAAAAVGRSGSGLERVRAALGDIARQLADVDRNLKPLVEDHAQAYVDSRQIRNWSS
jgi:chromosome segregation ATPase